MLLKYFLKNCCSQLVQLPKYLKYLHNNIKFALKLVYLSVDFNTRICVDNIPCLHIKFVNDYYS